MPLTDRALAGLARKVDQFRKAEKSSKGEKDRFTEKAIEELNRRGTKSLEISHQGDIVKVTGVYPEETYYDWMILSERLTSRQLKLIQSETVDREKLAEAIQSGKIDAADVAAATVIQRNKPWLSVSIKPSQSRRR